MAQTYSDGRLNAYRRAAESNPLRVPSRCGWPGGHSKGLAFTMELTRRTFRIFPPLYCCSVENIVQQGNKIVLMTREKSLGEHRHKINVTRRDSREI